MDQASTCLLSHNLYQFVLCVLQQYSKTDESPLTLPLNRLWRQNEPKCLALLTALRSTSTHAVYLFVRCRALHYSKDKIQQEVRPVTVQERTPSAYSACEQLITRKLPSAVPLPDMDNFKYITTLHSNAKQRAQAIDEESTSTPSSHQVEQNRKHRKSVSLIKCSDIKSNDFQEHVWAKIGNSFTACDKMVLTSTTHSSLVNASHTQKNRQLLQAN